MSANYVARELGYRMTGGWGEAATNDAFGPLETFGERFGAPLDEVVDLGFPVIDIWTAHLNLAWATPEHVAAAKHELERTGLGVSAAFTLKVNGKPIFCRGPTGFPTTASPTALRGSASVNV